MSGMKLDLTIYKCLSCEDFRVLFEIDIATETKEFFSIHDIPRDIKLQNKQIKNILKKLLDLELIIRNTNSDEYKLTYLAYDYLALRSLVKRNIIKEVGQKIAEGKESDIYLCMDYNDNIVCLKIHRLGRVCFRLIKNDGYFENLKYRNWLNLSKLAATKEYIYLQQLYQNNISVPKPIGINRHMIVMSYIKGIPLQEANLKSPVKVLKNILDNLFNFARFNIIHADLNEFNIIIDENENITIIDLPQIMSLHHKIANIIFDRDLNNILNFFKTKYYINVFAVPTFNELLEYVEMDIVSGLSEEQNEMLLSVLQDDKEDAFENEYLFYKKIIFCDDFNNYQDLFDTNFKLIHINTQNQNQNNTNEKFKNIENIKNKDKNIKNNNNNNSHLFNNVFRMGSAIEDFISDSESELEFILNKK